MKLKFWVVALILAMGLSGYAWYRTLTCKPVTGPRQLAWHGVGEGLAKVNWALRCYRDIVLESALWRGGMIVPCPYHPIANGWAYVDPKQREISLRWRLPPGMELARTVGLLPGPNSQLAIFFESRLNYDLGVGIAGPTGWVREPQLLGEFGLIGAAWVGETLEFVQSTSLKTLIRGDELRSTTRIVTVEGGALRERDFDLGTCDRCVSPQAAYRSGMPAVWTLLYLDHRLAEGGDLVAHSDPLLERMWSRSIDCLAVGLLEATLGEKTGEPFSILSSNGTVTAAPSPRSGAKYVWTDRFVIDDTITRALLWTIEPSDLPAHILLGVEVVNGRNLSTQEDMSGTLQIADTRDNRGLSVVPVAEWPGAAGPRRIIADGSDGYYVADASGNYIRLDHALRRTDPLSLREHLRQGGSRGRNEPEHERALAVALFGLPALFLLFVVVSVAHGLRTRRVQSSQTVEQRQPTGPLVRPSAIAFASILYLLIGWFALSQVLPLLS